MSTMNNDTGTEAEMSLPLPSPGGKENIVVLNGGGNGIAASTASITVYDPVTEGSGDASVDNLLAGTKWGVGLGTGLGLTASFSIAGSVYNYSAGAFMQPLSPAQIAAARMAMASVSAVAGIIFTEVTDSPAQAGDIRWAQSTDVTNATAYAYYPSTAGMGSDIWFGPNYSDFKNPVVGRYGYFTFIHELGHALGLAHPHDGTVPPEADEDHLKYSIMSYRDYAGDSNGFYDSSWFPTTLMLNDIAALQFLYGANTAWHTGDDTYSWDAAAIVYETIWDAGGSDTIDASSQAQAVRIDLNSGAWSEIGAAHWNGQASVRDTLAIAYGAVIENAIGSAFGDFLTGNAAANTLNGGLGNDALYGGDGDDYLNGEGGSDTIHGGNGSDHLSGGLNDGADHMYGEDGNDYYMIYDTSDIVVESNPDAVTGGVDEAYINVDYTLPDHVENLFLGTGSNGSPLRGIGNALDNVIHVPYNPDNIVDGAAGNDTLSHQHFLGSKFMTPADVGIVLDLSTTDASGYATSRMFSSLQFKDLVRNFENVTGTNFSDTLTGNAGNNVLTGLVGNDSLSGGLGNDTLDGGAGDDTLTGSSGADWLTGGEGNDVFFVSDATHSPNTSAREVIIDFTQAEDRIDLSGLLGATDLKWGNATAIANGIWFASVGTGTFLYADTGGDAVADMGIELRNTPGLTMTIGDFIGVKENAAPAFTSGAAFITPENTTAVATISATDADGDTLAWSIDGGADAAFFDLNSMTGELSFKIAPNFEAPKDAGADNVYDISLRVSDGTLSSTKDLAVTVTNVNEFKPVIQSAPTFTVAENTRHVTTISATDGDGTAPSYYLISNDDAVLFEIDRNTGDLNFKNAPDFEIPLDAGGNNIYSLEVLAVDGLRYAIKKIDVAVSDVHEPGLGMGLLEAFANDTSVHAPAASGPNAQESAGSVDAGTLNVATLVGVATILEPTGFASI